MRYNRNHMLTLMFSLLIFDAYANEPKVCFIWMMTIMVSLSARLKGTQLPVFRINGMIAYPQFPFPTV